MEREELKQVYAYASILWDTFKPPTDKAKAVLQAQIWFDFLRGYDLQIIFASMRELCKVSDFCNIGKVEIATVGEFLDSLKGFVRLLCVDTFGEIRYSLYIFIFHR